MGLMEWAVYGGTLAAKIGGKMVLNVVVPGSGSVVEFVEAANCFYNGDVCGGAISIISGAADLASFGLASATKDAMKEGAKGGVVQFAKETAKSGSKEASKTLGRQVAKEIAKDVTTEAAEEVWQAATKMTFNKFLQSTASAAVSSGGRQVWKTTLEDVGEKLLLELLKQKRKDFAFKLTMEAAKKGAEKEFMKHSYKFIVKDVGVSVLKGTINIALRDDPNNMKDIYQLTVVNRYLVTRLNIPFGNENHAHTFVAIKHIL